MARTAPAPNIPPIPGMCPSVAVLAGGGDAGGGGGGGAGDGSGDNNAGAGSGGENAAGDGRGAPDPQRYPECGYASHPVDVVTGRAFTHPIVDLALGGPLPLRFARMYSSKMAGRDAGLGFGWGHTFGWEIEVGRRSITVWNAHGVAVDFPMIHAGAEAIGPWGWVLRRETWGFAVDADDGLWHLFSVAEDDGQRFRLSAIEDRNRNRIALTYDDGKLVEVKDSAGRVIRVESTKEGRIASLHVQNAASQGQWIAFAKYTYDERGDLIGAADADGFSSSYAYDEDHRLVTDEDRAGLTFRFVYDRKGRCAESWGEYPGKKDPSLADGLPRYLADGATPAKGVHHCKFEYHDDGYSEVVDASQVRRFFGNSHGTLDKSVDGGAVMTAVYRDDGHILSRTDALGGTVSFDRDARGRVLRITDALGRVTSLERDTAGLPIQIVDPSGAITTAVRDRFGNLVAVTDALGHTTSYTHDERGLVTSITGPDGTRTAVEHDAQGNPTQVTLPNGGVWRYRHDAFGRVAEETDPLGAARRYVYSNRGDLVTERDPEGGVTSYAYDGESHLTRLTQPSGATTTMAWGGYHKLSVVTNPAGGTVRAAYDHMGDLIAVYNELGEAHRFTYDRPGRVRTEETIDGRTLTYRRDLLGRPTRIRTNGGARIELAYDAAGQLVSRAFDDDEKETFTYDAAGRLVSAASAAGEIAFEHDACGRLLRETQTVDDEAHAVEVTLDPAGRRASLATTLGLDERIERDALGARRRTILDGDYEIGSETDLLGRELRRSLPGGGAIESAFDPLGRLTRRRARTRASGPRIRAGEPAWLGDQDTGVTVDRAYRYDAGSNLVEALESGKEATRYEYDPLGHVLARIPDRLRAEAFRYDAAGNVTEAGGGRTYARGGRLVQKGDASYAWNDGGQLVEKRVRRDEGGDAIWSYAWGADGLLRSVRTPDGALVELLHDPFARRLKKRVSRIDASGRAIPVSVTRFVWDGDVLVHEIRQTAQAAGDPIVEERTYRFEEASYRPACHRERRRGSDEGGSPWIHYVNDASGAPDRLIDERGDVLATVERSVWGAVEPESQAATPLRLQGQYDDPETGLAYNRYRYYDPDAGRFISPDPALLRAGLNHFAFRVNPVGWIDPLGLVNIPTLTVPAGSDNLGRDMNREAIGHLTSARAAGASHHEMADMYEGMAGQIKQASKGTWGAGRVECADGSHGFIGDAGGRELAITPDRQIHVGPPGLIPKGPGDISIDRSTSPPRFLLGAPNTTGAGVRTM